VSLNDGPYTLL